ncbi:unnamed protein product [Ambrosiozyma monospora]|uniref:Unnamed protein product n=1 Tax=Ambrosiozyma monospora TaxID=43982 RepID=A0ACB5T1K3_AMBMO|nr:unnamed protein product [Ambrosiozyma monospora]
MTADKQVKSKERKKTARKQNDSINQPRKKRQYSRNGCKECKRRKLKCDEGKPECWNCLHLGKDCVYEKLIRFTDTRTFTIHTGKNAKEGKFMNLQTKQSMSKKKDPSKNSETSSSSNANSSGPVSNPAPSSFGHPLSFGSHPPLMQNPPTMPPTFEEALSKPQPMLPSIANLIVPSVTNLFEDEMRRSLTNSDSQQPLFPNDSKNSEFMDNIFTDASTLITDLNDLVQNFDLNYPLNGPFVGVTPNNLATVGVSGSGGASVNSTGFEAISPTNYSVHSNDTNEDHDPNDDYIKNLTRSLHTTYSTPPSTSTADMPYPTTQVNHSAGNLNHSVNSHPITESASVLTTYSPVRSQEMETQAQQSDEKVLPAYPPPSLTVLSSSSSDRFEYLFGLNNSISQDDLAGLASFFQWPLTSSHISYLKIFITKVQMNLLPFTTTFMHNAIINSFLLQAKNAPHLLFALLAISARYESYQASKLPTMDEATKKKIKYHNKLRSYYVSSCLKSLDSILHSKPKILNNIESLLMTILILACDYSASAGSQWRTHLKGAKDLIIKYCKFKPITLELSIIWLFFYSMETLAGLSIPSGGTIHDFDELRDFLDVAKSENDKVGLTLKKYRFLCAGHYVDPDQNDSGNSTLGENGIEEDRKLTKFLSFNLYLGFNDDIMDINRECILVIETVKAFKKLVSLTDVATCHSTVFKILNSKGHVKTNQLLKMMNCVRKAKSFTIITNEAPYRIPTNSPYHPLNKNGYHYNNPTGENLISSFGLIYRNSCLQMPVC